MVDSVIHDRIREEATTKATTEAKLASHDRIIDIVLAGLEKNGDRIGTLEGRMLVIEALGEEFRDSCKTLDELRIGVAEFRTQVKITWAFMFALVTALIGVAITLFQSGGVP